MKDFDYAKRQQKNRRKWWVVYTKQYSFYIWALPIFPFFLLWEKYQDWQYSRMTWSEERATRILDHVLPYVLEWAAEDEAFYYCMQWGHTALWRKAPRFQRKWARKFSGRLWYFLEEGYQKEGYDKSVETDFEDVWVKFQKRGLQDK